MEYAYKYLLLEGKPGHSHADGVRKDPPASPLCSILCMKKVMQLHWFTDTQQVRLNGWENSPLQLRMTMSESVHQGLIAQ